MNTLLACVLLFFFFVDTCFVSLSIALPIHAQAPPCQCRGDNTHERDEQTAYNQSAVSNRHIPHVVELINQLEKKIEKKDNGGQ